MDYKKDLKAFLANDVTQAFYLMLIFLAVMVKVDLLDQANFTSIVKFAAPAYFVQFLTNTEQIKKVF